MRPTIRLGTMAASAGLIAAALTATPATTSASPASPAVQRTVKTSFAMAATGHGTSVRGGLVPASSGATAYSSIGCTTRAGLRKGNYVAAVKVPGLGNVKAVRTRLWTTKKGRVVSSYAAHSVAQIVIVDNPLGKVTLEGVRSLSRAYHDGTRFRTESETQVAKIVFRPAIGDPQVLAIPTPGQPIDVPGLARIAVGGSVSSRIPDGVRVVSSALDIKIFPTDTRVRVAHTAARIQRGAPFGTFGGYSAGVRAQALANNVRIGRTPVLNMPCKGTDGVVAKRALLDLNLGGQAVVQGLATEQMGRQNKRLATGYERASVAKIDLGGGQVVVNGIVGKARVTRKPGMLIRSSKGTIVGSIVANGETYAMPETGVLEIPGLVKLEEGLVRNNKYGLSVIALRITLLDGTAAVIDLGVATMRIRKG